MSRYLTTLRNTQRMIKTLEADLPVLVAQARAVGDTWSTIGEALGMTKQGAVKRFGTVRERKQLDGQATIDDV